MNFSIHLDDRIAAALKRAAARQGRTRNAVITEAVKRWLADADHSHWPEELLNWKGEPRLPPFESQRPRGKAKPRFP